MKKFVTIAALLFMVIVLSPNSVGATGAVIYDGEGIATFREGNKDGAMRVECRVFTLGGSGYSRRLESCVASINGGSFSLNDHADLDGIANRNGSGNYDFSAALGWNNQETDIPGGAGGKSAWWMYLDDNTPYHEYVVMEFELHRIIGDNYRSTFDGTVTFFEDDPTP